MESSIEHRKEVLLSNIDNAYLYYPFNLLAIYCFKQAKTFNIKRLEDIKQVGRYIEGDNVVILVVELEVS